MNGDTDQLLPDIEHLLLIVVGAHLEAEVADRPLAGRLWEAVMGWRNALSMAERDELELLVPLVCTDLWYLNHRELLGRPTICVGTPEHNAATAYLAGRLPTALIIEERFRIHLDVEHVDRQACLWGLTPHDTADSVELFLQRYLDTFLRTAHGLPGEVSRG